MTPKRSKISVRGPKRHQKGLNIQDPPIHMLFTFIVNQLMGNGFEETRAGIGIASDSNRIRLRLGRPQLC
ncbi:MAG: hypothetical protein Q7R47_02190, partial [Candidatus Diapherotrites archaeon]|nr:hypothetical protein [Candidatus Diapherotrites archaeon]